MINEVLHQIIDLDNRAKKIKASATARAEKIVSDTKDELKEEETNVITAAKAVSYTHLDVYKRQTQCAAETERSVPSLCVQNKIK